MDMEELDQFMRSILKSEGFELLGIENQLVYGGRPAAAAFYRRIDCKLQICWSLRDGGLNFMLAPLTAPNELGFVNKSREWKLMLMLSRVDDNLETPRPGASSIELMTWMKALFEIHFKTAHSTLITQIKSR